MSLRNTSRLAGLVAAASIAAIIPLATPAHAESGPVRVTIFGASDGGERGHGIYKDPSDVICAYADPSLGGGNYVTVYLTYNGGSLIPNTVINKSQGTDTDCKAVPAAVDTNHDEEPGWLKIEIKSGSDDSIIDSKRVRVTL